MEAAFCMRAVGGCTAPERGMHLPSEGFRALIMLCQRRVKTTPVKLVDEYQSKGAEGIADLSKLFIR